MVKVNDTLYGLWSFSPIWQATESYLSPFCGEKKFRVSYFDRHPRGFCSTTYDIHIQRSYHERTHWFLTALKIITYVGTIGLAPLLALGVRSFCRWKNSASIIDDSQGPRNPGNGAAAAAPIQNANARSAQAAVAPLLPSVKTQQSSSSSSSGTSHQPPESWPSNVAYDPELVKKYMKNISNASGPSNQGGNNAAMKPGDKKWHDALGNDWKVKLADVLGDDWEDEYSEYTPEQIKEMLDEGEQLAKQAVDRSVEPDHFEEDLTRAIAASEKAAKELKLLEEANRKYQEQEIIDKQRVEEEAARAALAAAEKEEQERQAAEAGAQNFQNALLASPASFLEGYRSLDLKDLTASLKLVKGEALEKIECISLYDVYGEIGSATEPVIILEDGNTINKKSAQEHQVAMTTKFPHLSSSDPERQKELPDLKKVSPFQVTLEEPITFAPNPAIFTQFRFSEDGEKSFWVCPLTEKPYTNPYYCIENQQTYDLDALRAHIKANRGRLGNLRSVTLIPNLTIYEKMAMNLPRLSKDEAIPRTKLY